MTTATSDRKTVVLDVSGLQYPTERRSSRPCLSRRPGVHHVEVNPVSQTATVTFDPNLTSVRELARWVEECGYHCARQSVPDHLCDPLVDPNGSESLKPLSPLPWPFQRRTPGTRQPEEVMGHGGHTDGMVRGMRNRFLVAAIFSVPIVLWSNIGRNVLDKTGTLTKGEPEVTEVVLQGRPESEIVTLAAAVERESEHPLAQAVGKYADARGGPKSAAERFENVRVRVPSPRSMGGAWPWATPDSRTESTSRWARSRSAAPRWRQRAARRSLSPLTGKPLA